MSRLEARIKPVLGALMADISLPLNRAQQTDISVWALKTAMVSEASKPQHIVRCYQQVDCENLREHSRIPPMTRVWLGRFGGYGLGLSGTDVWPTAGARFPDSQGCVTTILVGHLAIQVLTIYIPEREQVAQISIRCESPGPWEELLVDSWPASGTISWPPVLSFTESAGPLFLPRLHARWKTGHQVDLKPAGKK
jgi:hypothetical protein